VRASVSVYLVTGLQASGKSTVARLLAERFEPSAHVEGDVMWKLVVGGRADMTDDPTPEAARQLELRYRHGAMLAQSFADNGFTAVHNDIILGDHLRRYSKLVSHRPLQIVVLCPRPEVVADRELGRGSSAYRSWMTGGRTLLDAIEVHQTWLDATRRIGTWIDSSDQTPDQTVDEILERTT